MIILGDRRAPAAVSAWDALRAIMPDIARIAVADRTDEIAAVFPEEEMAVARAVDARRREFALGRACARAALAELGVRANAIPVNADRSPRWPDGIVGSITHCAGFVGAAVAKRDHVAGLGFDAEPVVALDRDVVEMVCTPEELAWQQRVAPPPVADWPKVFFSAKESVHKCIAPMYGVHLDFREVTLTFDAAHREFRVALTERGEGPKLDGVIGRVCFAGEHLFTLAYQSV